MCTPSEKRCSILWCWEKWLCGHTWLLHTSTDSSPALTQPQSFFFRLSAYQNILYVMIICMLSRHHLSSCSPEPSSRLRPPGAGIPTLSGWGHTVDVSVALDLMSGNTSGGIGRSLIYRDAITFINARPIKWLPCFNLILPLANYHHTHIRVLLSALCLSHLQWAGRGRVLISCSVLSCVVSVSCGSEPSQLWNFSNLCQATEGAVVCFAIVSVWSVCCVRGKRSRLPLRDFTVALPWISGNASPVCPQSLFKNFQNVICINALQIRMW